MRVLIVALAVAGCQKTPPEAAPSKGVEITAEMPDTPEARAFAARLIETELTGLNPTGASEFQFEKMTFSPEGTYEADARLEVGGEAADCEEVGTWRIDEMADAGAIMEWTVTKTTCANRSAGEQTRVELALMEDGRYKAAFR